MEHFKSISPSQIQENTCRTPSLLDDSISTHFRDNIRTDSIGKTDYSELTNKFIIIPENIFTIEFDILKIDDTFLLRNIVCYIFKIFFEMMDYNKINSTNFKAFVKDVCDNYNDVPYHNFYHSTHILHTTFIILEKCDLFNKLNVDIIFSILISALVHDIGHPGNNNLFEINTCSELACRYNDLSVLEQFHCHLAFELIKKHNLFESYKSSTSCSKP